MQRNTFTNALVPIGLVGTIAAVIAASAPAGTSDGLRAAQDLAPPPPPPPDPVLLAIEDLLDATTSEALRLREQWAEGGIPFSEARMFLEENATDGDLGVQFMVDGSAWDRVLIFDPHWRRVVDIRVRGGFGEIGLTEIASESAEPSFEELPREEFLALIKEGTYYMFGTSTDDELLWGTAELTHTQPDQPVITFPEEEDEVDADEPFTVEWETVADPDPPHSVIESYHVVVEKDEDDERLRVWTVDMTRKDTSVTIPPGFLEAGKDYKVEIIAEETSGNKIITEVPFETSD